MFGFSRDDCDERVLRESAFAECDAAGVPLRVRGPYVSVYHKVKRAFLKTQTEGDDASPQAIAEAMSHFRLKPGYELACSMIGDNFFASSSFVVVHKGANAKPRESMGILVGMEICPRAFDSDGSLLAYWESLLLSHASTQFRLVWHANYMKLSIVVDLREFLRTGDGIEVWKALSPANRRKLLAMEFRPKVERVKDLIRISYTVFSPFGGFQRRETCRKENELFDIDSYRTVNSVKYNCGIMF